MHTIHELIIRPQLGLETEAAEVLDLMGAHFANEPGFVEGYTLDGLAEGGLLARVSVWNTRDSAERSAKTIATLSLRERLESLAHPMSEPLLDIVSERAVQAPAKA